MITGVPRHGLIGIDVGSHCIKAAQLTRFGKRIALTHAAVIQRSQIWSGEDIMRSPPLPSAAEIRAALDMGQFTGRRAAACASMSLCHFQSMSIPEEKPRERRTLVERELADHHRGYSFEFDYWDLNPDLHLNSDNVATLSLPTSWADQIAGDCLTARAACDMMDGLPGALARAVALERPSEDPLAVIDWGFSQASFCGLTNQRVEFVRKLPNCSFQRLLTAVTDAMSVGQAEARRLLQTQGLRDPDAGGPQQLSRIVERFLADPLRESVDQISRTLAFLRDRLPSLMPKQIYLLGGGATVRNVDRYLSERLEVPVKRWTGLGLRHQEGRSDAEMCLLGPAVALSAMTWEDGTV